MEAVLWSVIEALVSAINDRSMTPSHSIRVAEYSVAIGRAAGWDTDSLRIVRLGALIHDIGQVGWPGELLEKGALPLTLVRAHPETGAQIIEPWPELSCLLPYVRLHQEWVDGSGYPFGLHGEEIPHQVQAVSIADVYEALRQGRIYSGSGISHLAAISKMRAQSGRRWDEGLFDIFVDVSKEWSDPPFGGR